MLAGGGSGPRGSAPLTPDDKPSPVGFRDLFTLQDESTPALPMVAPSRDGRYEDAPKTKTHDVSLDDLMRMRA